MKPSDTSTGTRSLGTGTGSHNRRFAWLATHGVWLAPGLIAGLSVYLAYIATHDYPAFGAGLFFAMAEAVARDPVPLPDIVAGYTARGVPLAYPPLLFYVAGFLVMEFGVDPVATSVHLPHVASILALVPLYCFAMELLDSRAEAGLATMLAAVAPPLLQWQISAGGIVRAPAYLFTMTGLYAGLRLFRDGERRWLPLAIAAFGLTVLTHPVYTVFFAVSYLYMFAWFDRSPVGLLDGATVAAAGAVLSAPWWAQVVATHGVDVITGAAGTHGGIGTQLLDIAALLTTSGSGETQAVLFAVRPGLFNFRSVGMGVLSLWTLALGLAGLYLLFSGGRRFLPVWFLVTFVLVSKPRFLFLIGSMMIAAAFFRGVAPAIVRRAPSPGQGSAAAGVAVLLLVGAATGVGVLYASSNLDSHAGSQSLPSFIDQADVDAMTWAARHTRPGASFVALGDAAEWFPYLSERTILVGPWGVEWRGQAAYEYQLKLFNELSTCHDARCVSETMAAADVSPEYVYVPKGEYTTRGMEMTMPRSMLDSLEASDRYELVYQNEGGMIFEYEDHPESIEKT